MARRIVGVAGGIILALGMGTLLLIWLDRGEGAGMTGFLFISGTVAGIITVLVSALSGHE